MVNEPIVLQSCPIPSTSRIPSSHIAKFDRHGRRILDAQALIEFKERGFLSIPTLAPPSDIAQVRTIINALYTQSGREYGPFNNLLHLAPELRASSVFHACSVIAKQLLGKMTRPACDNALYKEPHGKHGTPWHQDAAFHSKYSPNNTIIFWIPLQDVTPENGCMHFIPLRKLQVLLPHRPFYPNDYQSMMTDRIDPAQAIACPLRSGDATVHGPLTLHAALANRTDFIRRTWTITFTPWGKWGFLTPARLLQRARLFHDRLTGSEHTGESK